MEPLSLTAGAIATLIFSKALEKGSEKSVEAIFDKIGQLLNLIREKFQKEGVEGKLTKAQEKPSEKNKSRFERELVEQMEDDEVFAKKLKALMNELKSDGKFNLSFMTDVDAEGNVKTGDIKMKATGGNSVNEKAFVKVKTGGDIETGNINLES